MSFQSDSVDTRIRSYSACCFHQHFIDIGLFIVDCLGLAALTRQTKSLRKAIDPENLLGAEQIGALDSEQSDGAASPYRHRIAGFKLMRFEVHPLTNLTL